MLSLWFMYSIFPKILKKILEFIYGVKINDSD